MLCWLIVELLLHCRLNFSSANINSWISHWSLARASVRIHIYYAHLCLHDYTFILCRMLPKGDPRAHECSWSYKNAGGQPSPGWLVLQSIFLFIIHINVHFFKQDNQPKYSLLHLFRDKCLVIIKNKSVIRIIPCTQEIISQGIYRPSHGARFFLLKINNPPHLLHFVCIDLWSPTLNILNSSCTPYWFWKISLDISLSKYIDNLILSLSRGFTIDLNVPSFNITFSFS